MSTLVAQTISNGSISTSTANVINGAKAWINYKGTATVSIRGSYNVSSVTVSGTGQYNVNFTNAFADANYAVAVSTDGTGSGSVPYCGARSFTTGNFQLTTTNPSSFVDNNLICAAVFR